MSGKVIAVANMKGGVGKTATVIALAEALAAHGSANKVLVIDLDAQANASICLAGDGPLAKLIQDKRTVDCFLKDYLFRRKEVDIDRYVQPFISDVGIEDRSLDISLFASSPPLRMVEIDIIYKLTQAGFSLTKIVSTLSTVIGAQLKRSRKNYDYTIVDCAPGISVLTEAFIRLADFVIIPTIPDPLSTYGLQTFCKSLWRGAQSPSSPFRKRPQASVPYVLFTRRRAVNLQTRTAEQLRSHQFIDGPPFQIFKTEIPECVAIATALGMAGKFPLYRKKWNGVVHIMESLVQETKEALNGGA